MDILLDRPNLKILGSEKRPENYNEILWKLGMQDLYLRKVAEGATHDAAFNFAISLAKSGSKELH